MTAKQARSQLLSLPYDIRYLIYQHAFPAGKQIYVQASSTALRSITTEPIPTSLLTSCRLLKHEAGQYLYNNYLFNLVGRKQDCLVSYQQLEKTMQKYTGSSVHVDAFSNGDHSNTMAIALHAGEGKVEMLKRRERGLPKTIGEMASEVSGRQNNPHLLTGACAFQRMTSVAMVLLAISLAIVACLLTQ